MKTIDLTEHDGPMSIDLLVQHHDQHAILQRTGKYVHADVALTDTQFHQVCDLIRQQIKWTREIDEAEKAREITFAGMTLHPKP